MWIEILGFLTLCLLMGILTSWALFGDHKRAKPKPMVPSTEDPEVPTQPTSG